MSGVGAEAFDVPADRDSSADGRGTLDRRLARVEQALLALGYVRVHRRTEEGDASRVSVRELELDVVVD